MEEEVLLNDQGLKMKCIIDGDDISFEFDKNISFLSKLLRIEKIRDFKLVYLGLKKILKISNNKIERILPITTTEVRVLRAYYNAHEELKSKKDLSSLFKEIKNKIDVSMHNMRSLNRKPWNQNQKLHAEFHTHFVEILSGNEFLDFVNKYNINFPMNDNGELDFEHGIDYSFKDVVFYGWDKKLIDSLSLKVDEVSDFKKLQSVNKFRDNLLNRCASSFAKTLDDDREWQKTLEIIDENKKKIEQKINDLQVLKKTKSAKYRGRINDSINRLNNELTKLKNYKATYSSSVVYNELFDKCLEKLSSENINYAEISYCNEKRIKYISDMHRGDERFRILFGMDRLKKVKEFDKMSKDLESLLNDGLVIGADILGEEHRLEGIEYDEFKDKLEWLLPVLHIHPNSVLRIHAGEFSEATENVYKTLKAIKEVSNKINESCVDLFGEVWGVVPPPRIRIGHGINIEKNPELVSLIHEMDATVEFNISSNYALGNVDDLSNLPLDFYHKNNINYVISTDGGGMYSTSILQEENIANNLQTIDVNPRRQGTKNDYINSAKETEKKILEENSALSQSVSEKDRELYRKYHEYKESSKKERKYSSFTEALDDENKILFGDGEIVESKKVSEEIFRLSRYIMDNHIEFDEQYYNSRISRIMEYSSKNMGDFSKIYLYLLENELFPEFDSSLRSVEFISKENENSNRIESELYKIYKLVSDIYESDSITRDIKRR